MIQTKKEKPLSNGKYKLCRVLLKFSKEKTVSEDSRGNEAYGMIFHVALKPVWTQLDSF